MLQKGGGASRDRTDDLYNAIVALSQLSYGPGRRGRVVHASAFVNENLPSIATKSVRWLAIGAVPMQWPREIPA
jgi:hypothetical protein